MCVDPCGFDGGGRKRWAAATAMVVVSPYHIFVRLRLPLGAEIDFADFMSVRLGETDFDRGAVVAGSLSSPTTHQPTSPPSNILSSILEKVGSTKSLQTVPAFKITQSGK
jgi:hypothetical protein